MLLYFLKIDFFFFSHLFIASIKNTEQSNQRASTMTSSICDLPSDHVSFSVAQARLLEFFEKFVPSKRLYCINPNCIEDTEGPVLYIWEDRSLAYMHNERQMALNITTMQVNGKPHWVQSHYCCECFKKHVLVGNNKNASQHYGGYCDGVQAVEVYFHNEPWPSTWHNRETGEVHVLTELQEYMLANETPIGRWR